MNNLETLNQILLSDNVVDNFLYNYNNNSVFRNWLQEVLPEIEDCKKQSQDHPWHIYGVLDHILHSIEAMNKQSLNMSDNIRLLLSYTMLLHDIGKPKCHIRRKKDGRWIDGFFGHNIESSKIAKRFAKDINLNQKDGEILAKLVLDHDIFMFIKDFPTTNPHWKQLTPELIKDKIIELNAYGNGKELLTYHVMVGRSDNLAQNPKMTGESLAMLDKFDAIITQCK